MMLKSYEGVEKNWGVLQDALVSAAEDIIPNEKRKGRKAWMTDEILELMEERRKLKKHLRGKISEFG